jgi:hypothetical protein
MPISVLQCWLDHSAVHVRVSLAKNPRLTLVMYEYLAMGKSDIVRMALASSKYTPISVLEKMLIDPRNDGGIQDEARDNIWKREGHDAS